ncbi:MAG TPA: papain-like cysteine protease family protein [Terracidiphilus sp.]|nr:papain-like cysteine protease family protein [Terracidiphilus sp.]
MPWQPAPYPIDSSNRSFQICYQAANESCFPASLAMARYYKTGRRAPEALARFAVQIGSNSSASLNMRDWDNNFTYYVEMGRGIAQAGLAYSAHTPGAYFLCNRCTTTYPAICNVTWNGGGGHAVVCLGQVPAGNTIVILDPWFGLQEVPIAGLPSYDPVGTVSSPGNGQSSNGSFMNSPHHYLIIGAR